MNRILIAGILTVTTTLISSGCATVGERGGSNGCSGSSEKREIQLIDPVDYVLTKLEEHQLVMIGERHWTREEPLFVQEVLLRCFEKNAVNYLFLEFGNFEDQAKVDQFLESPQYDPEPIIEVLRNSYEFGWGYQEYFDIFKLVHEENQNRPPEKRVKIVLVDHQLKDFSLWSLLNDYLRQSPSSDTEKRSIVGWLNDSVKDRDRFMADVIEASLFKSGLKGIYYAGSAHIRKDLKRKNYGRRYFAAGGLLDRRYPGRVFATTFHLRPPNWQDEKSFRAVENLFDKTGKAMEFDLAGTRIGGLKLKSDVAKQGVALSEVYDGYIILNRNSDYHRCAFVPGFYDDEFAEVVWSRLREDGTLERAGLDKRPTPTGEELMQMIE